MGSTEAWSEYTVTGHQRPKGGKHISSYRGELSFLQPAISVFAGATVRLSISTMAGVRVCS